MEEEKKGQEFQQVQVYSRDTLSNLHKVARGANQIEGTAQDLAEVIYYCNKVLEWTPDLSKPGVKESWARVKGGIVDIIANS
jgi:hypothetical protein